MKYFNRQVNMTDETRSDIQEVLSDLWNVKEISCFNPLENYLFGLYDGYNYEDLILKTEEASIIKRIRPELYKRLISVLDIVNQYPEIKKSQLKF